MTESVVAGHIGAKPFTVWQEPSAFQDNLVLYLQVAFLAQAKQIPPHIVGGVHIGVVDGQRVPRCRVMRMAAADALPAVLILDGRGDFFPVGRVFAYRFAGHV